MKEEWKMERSEEMQCTTGFNKQFVRGEINSSSFLYLCLQALLQYKVLSVFI